MVQTLSFSGLVPWFVNDPHRPVCHLLIPVDFLYAGKRGGELSLYVGKWGGELDFPSSFLSCCGFVCFVPSFCGANTAALSFSVSFRWFVNDPHQPVD